MSPAELVGSRTRETPAPLHPPGGVNRTANATLKLGPPHHKLSRGVPGQNSRDRGSQDGFGSGDRSKHRIAQVAALGKRSQYLGERVDTIKRYAAAIDRRMAEHVNKVVMRDKSLQSRTDIELELETFPLARTLSPLLVSAWVHYGETSMEDDTKAVAWIPHVVAIEWLLPAAATMPRCGPQRWKAGSGRGRQLFMD